MKRCTKILLLVLIVAANSTQALPDDRDQPIHITADKALRDEKRGVTIYSGHVHMRQGSMELEADTLAIYHDSENADQIVAHGSPAKMRQQPEPDQDLVHAHANVITYFKSEDRVHLKTDARIEQGGDLVTGDSIDYHIDRQLITAKSDESREGDKISVVIQPNPREEKTDSATSAVKHGGQPNVTPENDTKPAIPEKEADATPDRLPQGAGNGASAGE